MSTGHIDCVACRRGIRHRHNITKQRPPTPEWVLDLLAFACCLIIIASLLVIL